MPDKYDIKHYRGDAYSQEIKFKTDLGNPEDLTGLTIQAQVRDSTDLDAVLLFSFGIQRFDTEGRIILTLGPSATQGLDAGKYAYDVQINDTTRLYGSFVLTGDVSR